MVGQLLSQNSGKIDSRASSKENGEVSWYRWRRWTRVMWSGLIFLLFSFLSSSSLLANNLTVQNAELVDQSESNDTVVAEFDLSWNNAWRDSANYDAVWVFLKYSTDSGTTWKHATLKTSGTNPSGFDDGTKQAASVFTALDILVPTDKKGCFMQPAHGGSGTVSFNDVRVVWDYGANGLADADADATTTRIKIFGIEMVYIPQAGFSAGDGSDGTSGELEFGGATSSKPGAVSSEAGLSFGTGATQWYYNAPAPANTGEDADGAIFELSQAYPKGFQATYLMKYEITEGQWVAFFNTLTSAQKTTRDITAASGKNADTTVNRNTISWTTGDATTSKATRVINYLSWMDVCAYADWAGLRPMSELEFEKVTRGPISPVDGEYAWGTTTATACAAISGVSEDGTETCTTASANVVYNNTTFTGGDAGTGPVRSGIFATSSTTTRATTGASYYGVMELSGTVWERTVTLGNAKGRSFSGTHGDGILTTLASYEGNATNLDWPGIDSTDNTRGVTGAAGSGLRGGGWATTAAAAARLEVSNRDLGASEDSTRGTDYGGKLVRTAP